MTTNDGVPLTEQQAMAAMQAAVARADWAGAASVANTALASGMRDPLVFNILAFNAQQAGRMEEALGFLRQGLAIAPNDPRVLHAIGFCLGRLGQSEDAIVAFDAALKAAPGYAASLHHKGAALERLGRNSEAGVQYELAIASDPRYADPYGGRASIAARQGEYALARDFAARALAIDPRQATANVALGMADVGEGRFAAAAARMKSLESDPNLDPDDRPAVLALLGDALDGLAQHHEAFEAYQQGKNLKHEQFVHSSIAEAAAAQLVRIDAIREFLGTLSDWPSTTAAQNPSGGARTHAFLVGFPRSGTTLLEQVIASRPDAVTLDERPVLERADEDFLNSTDRLQKLLEADEATLDKYRSDYWRDVAAYGLNVESKIFVDKLPLNSLLLPVISRLFPQSKILFAERDPRDVVLSCYRRSFQMNRAMYHFTTLQGSAAFYDAVMGLVRAYRQIIPLDLHAVRYERLVADFETECRALCDFLDIDWDDRMKDFAETAKARAIRTPSASQVRKGLYSTGAGQWRLYADDLAPILPVLAPWVEAMGYPPA